MQIARILLLSIISCLPWAVHSQDKPANRLSQIQTVKSVRVCIWPDYYGITYRNPKTLALTGIDIDLANELGQGLGVAVVKFVDSSFAKLIDDLTLDRCDVAMFAVGITPGRGRKSCDLPSPHLASDIYAVASKTNRRIKEWADIDKSESVVAVAKGTLA
jgi:cyclohexadienyl dehydratase